jgi:hypothetical protein
MLAPINPAHYLQNHHSVVMAPFTDLRTRLEILPIPSEVVGCSGCIRKGYRVDKIGQPFTSCIQLPDCGGVTFVPDTEEWRRQATLYRLGVKP